MTLEFENLLKKYCTARIDIKNMGKKTNDIMIMENSDSNSEIHKPPWFKDNEGIGTIIESCEGNLDLKIKCIGDGDLKIWLRGPDVRIGNGQRFPVYIDYTKFIVNENIIINNETLVWHDKPFIFLENFDSDLIDIHINWLPFNKFGELDLEDLFNQIQSLKKRLELRESQINSIPMLSSTSYGYSALNGKVTYKNWLSIPSQFSLMDNFDGYCDHMWFTRYLKHRFPDEDFNINIFSVSNAHDNLTYPTIGKKVLYSAEDLNYRFLELKFRFDRYALDYVDLALGFDFVNDSKYLRFPYWMMMNFSPGVTEEEIENTVDRWNSTSFEKSENVVSIASHDIYGVREMISSDINKFVNVTYAGKWKNNTSDLWNKFNNNKRAFLNQFKFNICPENVLDDAYVTEKIFDAINCDCIPLYAGGGNYLEPKVINPDAFIRWTGEEQWGCDPNLKKNAYAGKDAVGYPVKWVANDDQNSDAIELFENILTDEKTYKEFKDQDKVLPSSTKYIMRIFSDLEKHFERLVYD